MSDDTKKSTAGAVMVKPISDARKPLSAAAAAPTPTKKVIIKSADMMPNMQKEAVDIAVNAFEKYNVEKDVAENIKKEFDKRHGPTWHCIVGRNFGVIWLNLTIYSFQTEFVGTVKLHSCSQDHCKGSYVTHETNHFVYFYLDQKAVLLFKSG
ncbi:dynein light chain 2, cytoplasmic-like [Senna tora]|uniref:Dynein light chain n=1 Tax=Senna tora TaxID=362788 RepID=A0A834WXY2_9FABA|nr:dynein light chain 2, cytoplasmic-like [Senna tora]